MRVGVDEEVRKEEKYIVIDLIVLIFDYLLEGVNGFLEFSIEKVDKMILIDVIIFVFEFLY